MNRRDCLIRLGALLATPLATRAWADERISLSTDVGNFRYVYSNPRLRDEFLNFLINVFHLYPENELHQALTQLCRENESDRQIYEALQNQMDDIRPFLGALRYAIPALKKQKAIMAEQTLQLVDPTARYDGHLEIGSTGRYIGILEDRLDVTGDVFLLHTEEAGFGPEDIVERGQIAKIGTHIDMGDYSTRFTSIIPANSLDMVTVFIGFHHCPVRKREEFISAVRSVISPGGTMILRDHDVDSEDMWRMAALAHDTFNAGTEESWQFNRRELRNFYSLQFIIDYIEETGFKHRGQVLFQPGDPTRNGLTAFTKV